MRQHSDLTRWEGGKKYCKEDGEKEEPERYRGETRASTELPRTLTPTAARSIVLLWKSDGDGTRIGGVPFGTRLILLLVQFFKSQGFVGRRAMHCLFGISSLARDIVTWDRILELNQGIVVIPREGRDTQTSSSSILGFSSASASSIAPSCRELWGEDEDTALASLLGVERDLVKLRGGSGGLCTCKQKRKDERDLNVHLSCT